MDISLMQRLCMAVILVSTSVAIVSSMTQSSWKQHSSETDVIFTTDLLFTTKANSNIMCSDLCKRYQVRCKAFSYTLNTKECRGYKGQLTGRIHRNNTILWERVCRRAGYTYDSTFDTCIRPYSIMKTWSEASNICNMEGSHLLITDTIGKIQATKNGSHSGTFLTYEFWWVGGYDIDESSAINYRWKNGIPLHENSTLWGTSQPTKTERCVTLSVYEERLHDRLCETKLFFACQEDLISW